MPWNRRPRGVYKLASPDDARRVLRSIKSDLTGIAAACTASGQNSLRDPREVIAGHPDNDGNGVRLVKHNPKAVAFLVQVAMRENSMGNRLMSFLKGHSNALSPPTPKSPTGSQAGSIISLSSHAKYVRGRGRGAKSSLDALFSHLKGDREAQMEEREARMSSFMQWSASMDAKASEAKMKLADLEERRADRDDRKEKRLADLEERKFEEQVKQRKDDQAQRRLALLTAHAERLRKADNHRDAEKIEAQITKILLEDG